MLKSYFFYPYFRPLAKWIRWLIAMQSIAALALFLLTIEAWAATRRAQSGVVTRVVDGDTVWVAISASGDVLKVRIEGIDAPEMCQPGGAEASQALKRRVMGQNVMVVSGAHDKFGRTVGTLHMQGQDMGRWMVAQGHAWVYSYRHKKGPYAGELVQAQLARRGVFSGGAAVEPRQFRKSHGSCYPRP